MAILHLQRQTHSPKEEVTVLAPQLQIHSLEVEEAGLPPQQLAGAYDVGSPAEALASGQSATYLCPALATTPEFQGVGAGDPSPQKQADVVKLLLPSEVLATGQSTFRELGQSAPLLSEGS